MQQLEQGQLANMLCSVTGWWCTWKLLHCFIMQRTLLMTQASELSI